MLFCAREFGIWNVGLLDSSTCSRSRPSNAATVLVPYYTPITATQARLLHVCIIRRRRRYGPQRSNSNPVDIPVCCVGGTKSYNVKLDLGLNDLDLDKRRGELPSPCRPPPAARRPPPAACRLPPAPLPQAHSNSPPTPVHRREGPGALPAGRTCSVLPHNHRHLPFPLPTDPNVGQKGGTLRSGRS